MLKDPHIIYEYKEPVEKKNVKCNCNCFILFGFLIGFIIGFFLCLLLKCLV